MTRRKAFTLIELLVVIAIIAILMSILMPALARTRRQAKSVICQTTLKQWGSSFAMYTDDNNSSFMAGRGGVWGSSDWWAALEPYYKDRKLLCCSEARNPEKYPWKGEGNFGTWGPEWFPDGFYGSYGINGYCLSANGIPNSWKGPNVKGPTNNIPLFMDSLRFDGWPESDEGLSLIHI